MYVTWIEIKFHIWIEFNPEIKLCTLNNKKINVLSSLGIKLKNWRLYYRQKKNYVRVSGILWCGKLIVHFKCGKHVLERNDLDTRHPFETPLIIKTRDSLVSLLSAKCYVIIKYSYLFYCFSSNKQCRTGELCFDWWWITWLICFWSNAFSLECRAHN